MSIYEVKELLKIRNADDLSLREKEHLLDHIVAALPAAIALSEAVDKMNLFSDENWETIKIELSCPTEYAIGDVWCEVEKSVREANERFKEKLNNG